MNRRRIGIAIACVMAAGVLGVPAAAPAAAGRGCQPSGQPPSPGTVDNNLLGVAVVSRCNVWAVGGFANNETSGQTLIEHWNGSRWVRVKSPNPGGLTRTSQLRGVAAVSANDIWAVGDYTSGSDAVVPLVIHWNGTAWRTATVPAPAGNLGILSDVVATSASDVWAVGESCTGCATDVTLTYHWNGKKWRLVTSPNPTDVAALRSVAAVSRTDVWAVGDYFNGTATQSLTMHWDDKRWKTVASPDPAGTSNQTILFGVAADSSKRAWAVGKYYNGTATETLTLWWNGKRWVHQSSPNPSTTNNALSGVVAIADRNAWAVGEAVDSSPGGQPLLEHWNGKRWKTVASPDPGTAITPISFNDVASLSRSTLIAVGTSSDGEAGNALADVIP
jgi:hypothetical protein